MKTTATDESSPLLSTKPSYQGNYKVDKSDSSSSDLSSESDGSSYHTGKLQRSVGVLSAAAILFGNSVGAGIFISPKGVYEQVGSAGAGLLVWSLTGIIATFCTLAYSELGTMIPRNGGEFVYIKRTLGDLPAFLFSFCTAFLIKPASNSVCALTGAQYFAAAVWGDDVPHLRVQLICVALLLVLGLLNIVSCKVVVKFCSIASFLKLVVFAFLVVCGVAIIITGHGQTQNWIPATSFAHSSTKPTEYALAFFFCFFSYQGWNSLNYMNEELKNPKRTLPLGGLIGVLMVTLSYVMANVAYLMLFTVEDIVTSDTLGMESGFMAFGKVGKMVMCAGLVVSTMGSACGGILVTSRMIKSTAEDDMFPRWMAGVSPRLGTPVQSLITMTGMCIMYVFVDTSFLIPCLATVEWLFYCLTFFCLLVLRWKEPKTERPFKIPLALGVFLVLITATFVILPIFSKSRWTVLIGLSFLPMGCVLYGVRHIYNLLYNKYFPSPSSSLGKVRRRASLSDSSGVYSEEDL